MVSRTPARAVFGARPAADGGRRRGEGLGTRRLCATPECSHCAAPEVSRHRNTTQRWVAPTWAVVEPERDPTLGRGHAAMGDPNPDPTLGRGLLKFQPNRDPTLGRGLRKFQPNREPTPGSRPLPIRRSFAFEAPCGHLRDEISSKELDGRNHTTMFPVTCRAVEQPGSSSGS